MAQNSQVIFSSALILNLHCHHLVNHGKLSRKSKILKVRMMFSTSLRRGLYTHVHVQQNIVIDTPTTICVVQEYNGHAFGM